MSIFYHVENFPFTVERESGDITETSNTEVEIALSVYQKLENIFNDNAQVKSCE